MSHAEGAQGAPDHDRSEPRDGLSEPAGDAPVHESHRALWLGGAMLALGLAGFAAWASLAPLDEGVPTQGLVVVDTKRKSVQHQFGGVVRAVMVREGQWVEQGQPLLELDSAVAQATLETARQRYVTLQAAHDRLLAESRGLPHIAFDTTLQRWSDDPWVAEQMATQTRLLAARRAALDADIQGLEASVRGQRALIDSYAAMGNGQRTRLESLRAEWSDTRWLVDEGYAPQNRQRELERQIAEIESAIADLQGQSARAQQAIAEARQRERALREVHSKEMADQLAEVTRDLMPEARRHAAAAQELQRATLRAPVAGQVLGLVAQTVGGVAMAGQTLMDIVPRDESLVLEARIPPHLSDRVHAGLAADVRFAAFAHAPRLVVQGRVDSVSRDLLTDTHSGQSYYLARVRVTPDGLRELAGRQLQPGMPAELVIKTGERTLLTYLIEPLTRRMAASMKEQ